MAREGVHCVGLSAHVLWECPVNKENLLGRVLILWVILRSVLGCEL